MASKDAIAKETTIAIRRLTEAGQALGDHLGVELPKLPIHPKFGQDHLRARQLSTLAGWLEQIGEVVLSQPESSPEPTYIVTPGAEEAMSKFGITAEQVMPEGGKITKREVDAYLDGMADELADDETVDEVDEEGNEASEVEPADEAQPDAE